MISAAVEKKLCLLLAGACLAAYSTELEQHCGMTLLLKPEVMADIKPAVTLDSVLYSTT